MTDDRVAITTAGPVATITLQRPERLNALDAPTMTEIVRAAERLDDDFDISVVVVAGAGRAFCAGADLTAPPLTESSARSGRPWNERREIGQLGRRMADAVERMRPATIARLHGPVIGCGVVLAAACDLRVAALDTTFAIPEIELGIPLAWGGIPLLLREFGPALTKELVMTCRPFDAAEARRAGFLNDVVEPDALDDAVDRLATRLAGMPSVPVAITKNHVNAIARHATAADLSVLDNDVLMNVIHDPASQAAAHDYLARRIENGD